MDRNRLTYGVVGTGAVGGYYGGRLAQAGHDVHFLFHSDYEHVRTHGLRVLSTKGDFMLHDVKAYASTHDMPQCDVVIVALKTVNEPLLAQLLPPLLKDDTVVLAIQNGIGVERAIQQMLPGVRLAAGMAFICAAKNKPGVVEHYDYGAINIGNYNAPDEVVRQVADDFCGAMVQARVVDYKEARWKKALWNMPFNGLSVLLDASTAEMLNDPAAEQLVRTLMNEVVEGARAVGCQTLDEHTIESQIDMTRHMVPYSPSMKLDWLRHRPMELEFIYTRAIAEAEQAGAHMPQLRMLEQSLRFMENKRNNPQ